MGKPWKQCQTLSSWAPKSLQMVSAAMKLKDIFSLEERPWPASVQFSGSVMSDFLRPHGLPGLHVHHQLLEPAQTHVHPVGDAIQPSHPLSSPSPPAFNFPSIMVFSNESVLHIRWSKYWNFSFSISPSNEYSRLISFRIDWFHLLAVQGALKSLLQHHSSKASVLLCSAFFMVQLSHPYMTTRKNIAFTRWTFVGEVLSLIFNMLSSLVMAFLLRSKCLLISLLQSSSAVILEPKISFFPNLMINISCVINLEEKSNVS